MQDLFQREDLKTETCHSSLNWPCPHFLLKSSSQGNEDMKVTNLQLTYPLQAEPKLLTPISVDPVSDDGGAGTTFAITFTFTNLGFRLLCLSK